MIEEFPETYALYYWPHIPGRGEFVRLVLEEAEADYVDVGRLPEDEGGGGEAVREILDSEELGVPAFAPPVLRHGELGISQTASICRYLAKRHGLVPEEESARLHAHQLQLTLQDFISEVHDTHHPISVMEYYEDQKEPARRRAAAFRSNRMPKFLDYFERNAEAGEASASPHLLASGFSYVDLSMAHVLAGLEFAFPNAFSAVANEIPTLQRLRKTVESREAIARYRASDRHLEFNEHGLFRHYPALDAD